MVRDSSVAVLAATALLYLIASASRVGAVSYDVNLDGVVNSLDVAIVSGCIGRNPSVHPICGRADIDGDGDVDAQDVVAIAQALQALHHTPVRTATSTATRPPHGNGTPTATSTRAPIPTSPVPTATGTATGTATPPPATPTNSPPDTATWTSTPVPTLTPTTSNTPTATDTATATVTLTATATVTTTATPSVTSTRTSTPTATNTVTATRTVTPSNTATATPTETATFSRTATQTPTSAPPNTATPIPTDTATPLPPPVDTATNTIAPTTPPNGLPPDPMDLAPALDMSGVTRLKDATSFLYTGGNPIQTGVTPGTITAERAAVLRGLVSDRSNAPLPGVAITVLGHPEFGQTLTREDGRFDLSVNGGGPLTVNYTKAGYLPAQRQINVPWEDFAILPDVVLVGLDPVVTGVDLTANVPIQVARGSQVNDTDGTRQATALFPQGITATMRLPDGSTQPISSLSVRATEFTVGPNGPQAMPAALPPTSAYTYAVDLSVDEAIAVGASQVSFTSPVPIYVENFLGFPIGTSVPSGSYDRQRGVWVPEPNGLVIRIVSVTGGMANLDTNGDGIADSSTALATLGITDAERQQLAALYSAGQGLWRVPVSHFTPYDFNMGPLPPADAISPTQDPEDDPPLDKSCRRRGSIIECGNQILGEDIGIVGTGFALHYQSDRVPGYKSAYRLEIPLTPAQIPPSLEKVYWQVLVAGQNFQSSLVAAANLRTTFTWDGRDAYGRIVQGSQPVTVAIYFEYQPSYSTAAAFAATGSGAAIGRARSKVQLYRVFSTRLGTWNEFATGLGGWSLSPHHAYDPAAQVLYRGDGERESAQSFGPTIKTVAGNGTACGPGSLVCGDGGPATAAQLSDPLGLAVGPDGSLYMADRNTIRRVLPDGTITRFAGIGTQCSPQTGACGDGGLAVNAQLSPDGVAVSPDGSVYIADTSNNRVRKVDTTGIITTIAGTGVNGTTGDGGPATLARLQTPIGITLGPDGSIYVSEILDVRRISPGGIITTYAGGGQLSAPSADGGPATSAILFPRGIAMSRNGTLFIAESTLGNRIRSVTNDGKIHTVAGSNAAGFSGDGGPATQAVLSGPRGVALGPDDTVYITDGNNNRVRWFRPGGTISTLAGTGGPSTTGDGGLAQQASIQALNIGLAVGPDGSIYLSQETTNLRVRRIAPPDHKFVATGLIVPAADGSEVYTFTSNGQHLQTLDALTGTVRFQFGYDAANRLTTISDANGNVTTIDHDGQGRPTGITGPFGSHTSFSVNASGYLTAITNPANETVQIGYDIDALLTSLTRPGGQMSTYSFDAIGLLAIATDATNATTTLFRTGTNGDHTVRLTSPLGRVSTYHTTRLSTGDVRVTTVDAGTQSTALIGRDGHQSATQANGTTVNVTLGPDPRWGMRVPVTSSRTTTTPGGKVFTTTSQRTATLADPSNLLGLLTFTTTHTINGRVFTASYNAATRTVTQTSPTGRSVTVTVDASGRAVQQQLPGFDPISYGYDTRGRLQTVSQGVGPTLRTYTFTYDSSGFLESNTAPLNQVVRFDYDAAGRVTQEVRSDNQIVGLGYDAHGNPTTITPPGRPSHVFSYNSVDLLSSYTAPDLGPGSEETLSTYNSDRQLTRVALPTGQNLDLTYDNSSGRLNSATLPRGQVGYTYDAASGNLTSITAPDATLSYSYDGSLLTRATWAGAITGNVGRSYDTNLRLASQDVDNANAVTFQYDNDGLLTGAGSLTLIRDPQNGRITGTTLANVTDTFGYNSLGEMTSYSAAFSGSPIYANGFTRDSLSRITSKTETIAGTTDTFAYDYDPAGRLIEVKRNGVPVADYTYGANGQRLTGPGAAAVYSYDSQDRLLSVGTQSFTYTANGELATKTNGASVTSYTYDGIGTLTRVILPTGTQIDYLIDGQNRRIGKKVNGTLVKGYLYASGLRPVAELDANNNVASRFVYSDRANVPAYMINGGTTYRIITDYLGSPRVILDASTGAVLQRMDYDEFGNVLLDTNPGFQPFGFAGGLYDADTQLVRFGARDYDAAAGRWTSKDPLDVGGGDTNFYGYVLSDPVNGTDAAGLVRTTVDATCPEQPEVCGELERQGLLFEEEEATEVDALAEATARRTHRDIVNSIPRGTRVTSNGTSSGTGFAGKIKNGVAFGGALAVAGSDSSAEASNQNSDPAGSSCTALDLLDGAIIRPSHDRPMWDLFQLFLIDYREGKLTPPQIANIRQRVWQAEGFDVLDFVQ